MIKCNEQTRINEIEEQKNNRKTETEGEKGEEAYKEEYEYKYR